MKQKSIDDDSLPRNFVYVYFTKLVDCEDHLVGGPISETTVGNIWSDFGPGFFITVRQCVPLCPIGSPSQRTA